MTAVRPRVVPRRRLVPGLLAAGILILGAVFPTPPAGGAAPAPGPRRQSVLLITVASLRADRLGYGSGGKYATPAIDRLAARGVRFERAYAASPSTIASAGSLMTGLVPARTNLRSDLGGRLKEGVPTVAESFRKAGYRTGAVLGSYLLDSDRRLASGFDTYLDEFPGIRKMKVTLSKERRADDGVQKALGWLAEGGKGKPFFLWLDFFDPHYDYDPPEGLLDTYKADPYQGEVAHVDAQIGVLLEALKQRGLEKTTQVILAGLHGEGLGDHKETGHGTYLYETTIRVPLIVVTAGDGKPGVSREPVSLLDVAPTLLELNGLPPIPDTDGTSLKAALNGAGVPSAKQARRIFVEAYAPFAAYGWSPMYAVIEGDRKIVSGRRVEAVDLAADPGEAKAMVPAPEWSAGLAAFGAPLLGSTDPPAGLRAQVRRLVDDLDPPWNYSPICMDKTEFPDPRDRVELNDPLFRMRIDAHWKVAGRAANSARDEVQPTDPSNYTALDMTASLSLRNGWTEYLNHDLEILQCNYPLRPLGYHYYAHGLEKAGDKTRAEKALKLYALLDPEHEEPYYDLAVLYAQSERKDLALDNLAKSLRYGAEDLDFIRRDGRLRSLRDDPRFVSLVGPVTPPAPSR